MEIQATQTAPGGRYFRLLFDTWARDVTGGKVTAVLFTVTLVASLATILTKSATTWPAITLLCSSIAWVFISIPLSTFQIWREQCEKSDEALSGANLKTKHALEQTEFYKDLVDRLNEPDFRNSFITHARMVEHNGHLGIIARLVIINLGANAKLVGWKARARSDGAAVAAKISQIPVDISRTVLGKTRFIHDLSVNVGWSPFCRRDPYRGELWAEFEVLEIEPGTFRIDFRDENGRLYEIAPDETLLRDMVDQARSEEPFPTDIPTVKSSQNDG